jgi:hypothetical protein
MSVGVTSSPAVKTAGYKMLDGKTAQPETVKSNMTHIYHLVTPRFNGGRVVTYTPIYLLYRT